MMRTTLLAAMAAALMIPAAHAQNNPSTSPGGQDGAGNRGTIGGQQAGAERQAGANRQGAGQDNARTGAGQDNANANTARTAAVSDQLFATAAAAAGLAEVSLSELGVRKATDPDLKQFSQRMIDEHTKANQELMQVAGDKGVTMPEALDARAAFCAQSLAGLSGEEFDKCYAKAQLIAHMDSAAMFKAEAERGTDPQMKAYAAKTLAHIEDHLNTIKPIAMKYNPELMQQHAGGQRSGDAHDEHSGAAGAASGRNATGGGRTTTGSTRESGTSGGTTGTDTPGSGSGSDTPRSGSGAGSSGGTTGTGSGSGSGSGSGAGSSGGTGSGSGAGSSGGTTGGSTGDSPR